MPDQLQPQPVRIFTVALQSQSIKQERTIRQTFKLLFHSRTAVAGFLVILFNFIVYSIPGLERLQSNFAPLSFAVFMVIAGKYALEDTLTIWAEMRLGGTFRDSIEQPVKAILEETLPIQMQRSNIIAQIVRQVLAEVLPEQVQNSVDDALDELLDNMNTTGQSIPIEDEPTTDNSEQQTIDEIKREIDASRPPVVPSYRIVPTDLEPDMAAEPE